MTLLDIFSKATMVVSAFNLFISIPIYIICILAIVMNKKKFPFNSTYFTIFIALGIIDIACFVDFLGEKICFWGFFPSLFQPYGKPNLLAKINSYFIWFTGFAQYYLIILTAVNRYVALCWPLKYQRIFLDRNTYIMISVCILVPAIYCIPILLTEMTYVTYTFPFQGENFTFAIGPAFIEASYTTSYYNLWQGGTGLLIISSTIMYALMIVNAYKHRKERKNDGHKIEMKLFYAGLCIFMTCIFYVAFFFARIYVLQAYANDVNVQMYTELSRCSLFILADIFSLNNHFVILLLSPELRKQYIAFFRGGKNTSNLVGLIFASNTRP